MILFPLCPLCCRRPVGHHDRRNTVQQYITLGADQFNKVRDQDIFFNWYFIILYVAAIVAATAIVYIQSRISWALGLGPCASISTITGVVLLSARFYHRPVAHGNRFT